MDKIAKIKKLADAMYYAAQYLTTDASRLHKAMDEYHKFIIHEYHKEEHVSEIDFEQELHKYFGQVKDFTLCVNIAKHFYDEGYFDGHIHDGDRIEHVDGRKVNVSRFKRVAKPLEEPISEDLEEAIKRACEETRLTKAKNGHPFFSEEDFKLGFSNAVQWQKEQFEKERLKHCEALTEEQAQIESDFVAQHLKENNRTPTFIDAIEYGMRFMKEQIMKGGVEGTIKFVNTGDNDPFVKFICPDLHSSKFRLNQRVKNNNS